jgi:predicted nucleic acid-binding protein
LGNARFKQLQTLQEIINNLLAVASETLQPLNMRIQTLYLDTSVIGGYFDDEFKDATQELWRQMKEGRFLFVTSVITSQEISTAPERVRDHYNNTFNRSEMILGLSNEMEDLSDAYLRQGVVSLKYEDDANHVAACTVARIDYLVSWNFKHLVNVEREKGFNAVNLLQGYLPIRIVNPLELIYGHENQDF